jgi:hypothetical protein
MKSPEELGGQEYNTDPSQEQIEVLIERWKNDFPQLIETLADKYHISEEQRPEVIMALEGQLQNIYFAYGGRDGLSKVRLLDLGSGATSSPDSHGTRFSEPWLCRALAEWGADPVGVDIGHFDESESFEHHSLDLQKQDALKIFSDKSFDAIHASLLKTSPTLESSMRGRGGFDTIKFDTMMAGLRQQASRLLRDGGKNFTEGKF